MKRFASFLVLCLAMLLVLQPPGLTAMDDVQDLASYELPTAVPASALTLSAPEANLLPTFNMDSYASRSTSPFSTAPGGTFHRLAEPVASGLPYSLEPVADTAFRLRL